MPPINKKFQAGAVPKQEKRFVAGEQLTLYKMTPKWSFSKCDLQHEKWGILPNTQFLGDMLARFKAWESGKWGDILTATSGRKHNTQSHPIPIERLAKDAKNRIIELHLDSYDILYSLAISGKYRIWGIMIEETGTFQLLWIDPRHEIYPLTPRKK